MRPGSPLPLLNVPGGLQEGYSRTLRRLAELFISNFKKLEVSQLFRYTTS